MPLASEIRLRFIKGDLKGKVYKVEGETIVLGRGDECDIRLNDPNVSRKHAVILCKDGDIFIKDNASKNGVSVNGQKSTFHKFGLSDPVPTGGSGSKSR